MSFHASDLARLPEGERIAFLSALTEAESAQLRHDWSFWGRPEQRLPKGDWINWLILAGRGFGKTRTGAETVRQWTKTSNYVNLIGATADDVREIMVDGESGILAICPRDERPRYIANKNRLEWPNGARSLLFTAEEPDRFRGKQHSHLWMDELASWRYHESYDQAAFGLRLGNKPQAIITTTPRPIKIIRDLISDPTTIVTRGSTYDNAANLADAFVHQIVKKYEGTRLGRQELNAQILDDVPGALWTRDMIDRACAKRDRPKRMIKIVVALDPSVSNNEGSDEFGMVVVGKGDDGHGYVLEDASAHYSVTEWPKKAIDLYKKWKADKIVAEINNGGDMVEATIRTTDPYVSFTPVHATRGKVVRAQPISMLYEKNLMHHLGSFPKLEDQMCEFTENFDKKTAGYSPDRVDALVWGTSELLISGSTYDTSMSWVK